MSMNEFTFTKSGSLLRWAALSAHWPFAIDNPRSPHYQNLGRIGYAGRNKPKSPPKARRINRRATP